MVLIVISFAQEEGNEAIIIHLWTYYTLTWFYQDLWSLEVVVQDLHITEWHQG